jgi:4-hydroxy-3-polyprenylbenzoate decarboxylase
MAYRSLRDFLRLLEEKGRLSRVKAPVSPFLEITEIHTRLMAEGGPAVLFENVVKADGGRYDMPVLANLFGTVERVAWGMGREPHQLREVGETLAFLRQPEPPGGWREALEMFPLLKTVMVMKPRTVGSAPCQDIVLRGADIDLARLPIQTCWPGEPAPLITWPLIVTRGPGKRREDDYNLGIYRMQVTGKNTTLMRWLKHRGGAQHHARWKGEKREPFPAAAVIGADPGTILAAVTPVPDTVSEYQFAGLLRGAKTELVDCKTVPLKVPAEAEIVLEGHVSLDNYQDEGPYGDHTGYYNSVEQFPVFEISAITMRREPIYLSTAAGRALDPGHGAERGVHSAVAPAVSGDRRFLAAARGLLLPHRRRLDEEGVSGPCQARDDGRVVLSASVHVHEMGHRGGRRHRRARLEGRDVGPVHPHGPGARHHTRREHAHRLPGLRLA